MTFYYFVLLPMISNFSVLNYLLKKQTQRHLNRDGVRKSPCVKWKVLYYYIRKRQCHIDNLLNKKS